ncbi:ATP-binding protein [Burkholderia catarinensis]|uniref:ATP-binding protein n=1 Tax=Burkholderia catarinensis TaxID=1108140 RepID=UPI00091608BF|nr:winged helix-turn-helix domain-containing protein [Burkholderia catarinensis]KAG8153789.1 transcriptional regulator [Burkholderia catarinensis]
MIQIGSLSVDFEQRDIRRDGLSLRVGARAFDILEVLHRASGSIVSKDDIMDAVWPGLIVEENRLQVHIATLRKALGVHRNLIKTVPGRGYVLVCGMHAGARMCEPADAPAAVGGERLQVPPLIGREAEIGEIVDMLDRTPVVTLVGAGGIGKTTLAVRIAHDLMRRTGERAHVVELAQATTGGDVLGTLADALALQIGDAPSIDEIARAIAGTRCLLVLDNAEHVIDLIANLVEALVARTDTVRVLVTSREPLHISVESVFRVDPLTVPERDADCEAIAACSAVELFLCRVHAATPDCAVDESRIRVVGDICRRLEGLPLAIELAAARVATLGIEGVASRLDDRLNLLTGGLRSALPRHQALRATFDWSYVLLDPAARALFRRMGCFTSAFSFDAVRAVAIEADTTIAELIAGLGELVAKSLLNVEFSHANARYRLSESTRAYALEKLRNEGEFERVVARHMRYEQEQATARAAIGAVEPLSNQVSTAIDASRFPVAATLATQVPCARVFARELLDPSGMSECGAQAKRLLDEIDTGSSSVDPDDEMHLRAAYASALLHTAGDVHAAAAMWSRALGLARDAGNDGFDAHALAGQWHTALAMSDVHESLRYAMRFERAAERSGVQSQRRLATAMVATSLHYFGEHAQARERLDTAMAAFADTGEPRRAESALGIDVATLGQTTLTRLAWMQGEPEHAVRLAAQAVESARSDRSGLALCVVLGAAAVPIALDYGDHDVISDYLATLRSASDASGFDIWHWHAECLTGQFDIQAGHPGTGLARLEPALRHIEASGFRHLLAPLVGAYAEGLVRTGRATEANAKLDAMMARCRSRGEHLFIPELLRVKGLTALEQARNAAADLAVAYEAEGRRQLLAAIHTAKAQGAGMWELRATADLADYLIERGGVGQAASLVAGLSGRFDLCSRASDIRRLVRLQNFVRAHEEPRSHRQRMRFEATADAAQTVM